MKTDTRKQLLDFIREKGAAAPSRLAEQFQISPQMVHRHLNILLQEGLIKKLGRPPKVLYQVVDESPAITYEVLPDNLDIYINQHYLAVKPSGEVLEGIEGFQWWAQKTRQHKQFKRLAQEYVDQHGKINTRHRNIIGLIDATFKIEDTFEKCFLDILYYQEFYSVPKFSKTRTGQMIFLGKSGQDIDVIRELASLCLDSILAIIRHHNIQAVIFTPHSIPRKVSFLKEFERFLSLPEPTISLLKVFSGKAPVAQKSLQKLSDRIENANSTIFVKEDFLSYERILVVDDAVGSGATLNAIAEKLKRKGAKFVCGFAVTGSLKRFEVLNEI